MVPVISVVGTSPSGKTTLLDEVITRLKSKRYRVAVIKHGHNTFNFNHEGKDTWRFTQEGSGLIVFSSPTDIPFIENRTTELTFPQVLALVGNKVDIVLIEGYSAFSTDRICLMPYPGNEGEPLATTQVYLSTGEIIELENDDINKLVDILEKKIDLIPSCQPKGTLGTVDSRAAYEEYQTGKLDKFLAESASIHGHNCSGQVLGIRMALRGCYELGIELPIKDKKRLIVYVEIDRCATDAIQIVTGCKLGKRTMKFIDYGKLAATFVDTHTGNAVRLSAREDAREKAALYQSDGITKQQAESQAYRIMPDENLFTIERVVMQIPRQDMPGSPVSRVICDQCGEGINDGREVEVSGRTICRSCAYGGYYQHLQ